MSRIGCSRELLLIDRGNNMPEIAWRAKVTPAFKNNVINICAQLGCNPDYLMAAMAFESGDGFSPKKKNVVSGATGLIQFMPSTAQGMSTSIEELESMTDVEQLDWVLKYFMPKKGKLTTLSDLYMAILWPAAVGKPEDTPIFMKGTIQYTQKAGLDHDGDGQVTKAEAAAMVEARLYKGLSAGFKG
jgi:hypothetical protein